MPSNEEQLRSFCRSLAPPKEWISIATSKIQTVFELLKQDCRYGLDRCEIVGGMGKKTSTCVKVDVDAIIYYNDNQGGRIEMEDVLNDWEDILLLKTDLERNEIHKTKKLLTFRYDGIPIDLVAILNKVPPNTKDVLPNTKDVERVQMAKEFLDAKGVPEYRRGKDLTLSGANLQWMREKSLIAHEIARLGKFWSQTILFTYSVPGQSYIFEHIAVKAVEDVCQRNKKSPQEISYLETFKRFLEMVRDIRNLQLIFTDEYKKSDIPANIMQQKPLLLDSVNPYRNLLDINNDEMRSSFIKIFSECAEESIKRFSIMETMSYPFTQGCEFETLFMPQPLLFNYPYKIVKPLEGTFMVSCKADNLLLLPKPEIRLLSLTAEEKKYIDILLYVFATRVSYIPYELSLREKQEIVEAFVGKMMGKSYIWNHTPTKETHEGRDCSLRIPFGGGYACWVSFNFDPTSLQSNKRNIDPTSLQSNKRQHIGN